MPNAKDLVIFTQTYDLLTWLLPQCERFPKSQRFVVTQRLQGAALDFQEAIFEANARGGAERLAYLQAADAHLNKLRLYLRLSRQWEWLGSGQYAHVSRMVAQVGKLLGGWIKQTRAASTSGHSGRGRAAEAGAG
ncbi:MAG: diversity-generating retroelement protein Avd [Gammaproteobacteria bacterium]|nr:diversity-generating retroelement protein Avd [Gammaproteobacteria bacterium]